MFYTGKKICSRARAHSKKLSLIIICGGPSQERGISLNSARSLYDNLDHDRYFLSLIYFNPELEAFSIDETQIYSNTPMDFDYLLHLKEGRRKKLSPNALRKKIREADIIFPAIHGTFGEDGKLQKLLESAGAKRYIGSGPAACKLTNNKHACGNFLKRHGFFQLPSLSVKKGGKIPKVFDRTGFGKKKSQIYNNFAGRFSVFSGKAGVSNERVVVKPQNGGSSIGVYIVESQKELEEKIQKVFQIDDFAVIEPFCEGREFTIIVLGNARGEPVALVPTEIEFLGDTFFDYRKKYLATGDTRYHCPPKIPHEILVKMQREAEKIFQLLKMRDMARLDFWLLPDGKLWFSDINAISGMEQNSFLFLQPALLGFSHRQLLQYILEKRVTKSSRQGRVPIPVIFGGTSAERHVSIMSGTNVWMKLKSSSRYFPIPYFYSRDGYFYHIPHFFCLHHTAEEVEELIHSQKRVLPDQYDYLLRRLGIEHEYLDEPLFVPRRDTLRDLAQKYSFVFLGLHGSPGEDGTLQRELDRLGVCYNGPGAECSKLCMDKFATGEVIRAAKIPGVSSAKKMLARVDEAAGAIWQKLVSSGFSGSAILKPRGDGCSAGILRIHGEQELEKYLKFVRGSFSFIPENAIHHGHGRIDLPQEKMKEILIEEFIETDRAVLHHLKLDLTERTGWIEVTCGLIGGVIGKKNVQGKAAKKNAGDIEKNDARKDAVENDSLHAFQPSQTVADLDILSLEEKFMGGTGVNFTPPPRQYVSPKIIKLVRSRLVQAACALGTTGYSRIDFFLHRKTGEIIIIEANTLPGLTPSTVLFHQGLAEKPPLLPRELLEKIIELGMSR